MAASAAKFQFRRAIEEYARWLAVDQSERSPAPAWWWAPAFAMREELSEIPPQWAEMMGLPPAATFADAAGLFLQAMAGQTFQPWPEEFPRCYRPLQASETIA